MVGAIVSTGLFESAEVEDSGDKRPEVRDVGDDDGGGCFACVPVQVDEGRVWSGEICNAVENGAEDLLYIKMLIPLEVEDRN